MTVVESVPTVRAEDSAHLVRMTSTPARLIMALFVVANAVFVFSTIEKVNHALPVIVAMLVVNAAAVLLVLDKPDPLPLTIALAIIAAVVLSNVLVWSQLTADHGSGRVTWQLGSSTWILFFVALRRRAGLAWLGFAAMVAISVAWAVSHGKSPIGMLLAFDTQAAILLVGTLFGRNLRTTSAAIARFQRAALDATVTQAAVDTAAQIRTSRVGELRSAVEPLLQELAGGAVPGSESERRRFGTAEGALRDGVRARSLLTPAIIASVAEARDRGVEVQLLDDRGHQFSDAAAIERIEKEIATILAGAHGRVVARLLPLGRAVAVSLVAFEGDDAVRVELDAEGHRLPARPEGFEPPTF